MAAKVAHEQTNSNRARAVSYPKPPPAYKKKEQERVVEKPYVQLIVIDDDEMGEALKANFEAFVSRENDSNNDEEDDIDLYKDLKEKNQRSGDEIFCMLLAKVFDENTTNVEQHLANYLKLIYDNKLLVKEDFEGGLNKFSSSLADIALDVPMIHRYMAKIVI